MNELERWANFYLLMSAAAATLIGLLFVIITLGVERSVEDGTAKIRMYVTPTVLFRFCTVPCRAADLPEPHSVDGLSLHLPRGCRRLSLLGVLSDWAGR
jgi:hypothetical protein